MFNTNQFISKLTQGLQNHEPNFVENMIRKG
jgi:hypothetical protein